MKKRPRRKTLRIGPSWKPSGERPRFTFTVTGDLPDLARLASSVITQAKLQGVQIWDRPKGRRSRV